MKLDLSDNGVRELVRQSLLDTIVNSENFIQFEKDMLNEVYSQIVEYDEDQKK